MKRTVPTALSALLLSVAFAPTYAVTLDAEVSEETVEAVSIAAEAAESESESVLGIILEQSGIETEISESESISRPAIAIESVAVDDDVDNGAAEVTGVAEVEDIKDAIAESEAAEVEGVQVTEVEDLTDPIAEVGAAEVADIKDAIAEGESEGADDLVADLLDEGLINDVLIDPEASDDLGEVLETPEVVSAPLPAGLPLLLAGLVGLWAIRRWKA